MEPNDTNFVQYKFILFSKNQKMVATLPQVSSFSTKYLPLVIRSYSTSDALGNWLTKTYPKVFDALNVVKLSMRNRVIAETQHCSS